MGIFRYKKRRSYDTYHTETHDGVTTTTTSSQRGNVPLTKSEKKLQLAVNIIIIIFIILAVLTALPFFILFLFLVASIFF